jgi:hypothetical protein
LAEVSLSCYLVDPTQASKHILCSELSFAKGTAERLREKSWIRREHAEMARAVLAAELCVLHSVHPYTEGEAISSPNLG